MELAGELERKERDEVDSEEVGEKQDKEGREDARLGQELTVSQPLCLFLDV